MVTLPAFRAVIFDMDGLLLDSERIARHAWKQAGMASGYNISDAMYLQVVGRTVPDAEHIFATLLGDDFPFKQVRQLRLQIGEDYIAKHGLPQKPGAEELLTRLEALGMPKAVATSTARDEAWRRLRLAGLARYFSVLCGGDDILRGKPEPDLFLETAARLGVRAQECVVLEDSEYGLQAAKRAGMIPILVPDLKPPGPDARALAYAVFASLHDVRAAMEAMLQGNGDAQP
jgi:HAD superfamily hydrolase (TIGR01509 family)